MTLEEKQTIFKLREIIDFDKKHRIETIYDKEQIEFRNNIELVLDLVEKLQKENEELKNGKVYQDFKYYKELAGQYQGSCVSKDKIRKIIEELNKNIEEEFKKCSGRGPTIALHSLTFCRDEFKELLEEE